MRRVGSAPGRCAAPQVTRFAQPPAVLSGALALALAVAVWGCGERLSPEIGPPASSWTLDHGRRARTYLLYVPRSFAPGTRYPVVVALHDASADGVAMERLTGLNRVAEREGFLVVYPEAVAGLWRHTHTAPGGVAPAGDAPAGDALPDDDDDDDDDDDARAAGGSATDDVAFVAAVIDHVAAAWPVDRDRIYLTGVGEGALLGYRLVCDDGRTIRAFAPVLGALPEPLHGPCAARAPLPVVSVVGTADPVVPFAGGSVQREGPPGDRVVSVSETLRWWRSRNGCEEQPELDERLDAVPVDGTQVRRARWQSGCPAAALEVLEVQGGGHAWPQGTTTRPQPSARGTISQEFDAAEEIWAFFARHRRAVDLVNPYANPERL